MYTLIFNERIGCFNFQLYIYLKQTHSSYLEYGNFAIFVKIEPLVNKFDQAPRHLLCPGSRLAVSALL